jgi:hypothetical protein
MCLNGMNFVTHFCLYNDDRILSKLFCVKLFISGRTETRHYASLYQRMVSGVYARININDFIYRAVNYSIIMMEGNGRNPVSLCIHQRMTRFLPLAFLRKII